VRDEAAVRELCSVVPGLDVHVMSAFKGSAQNLAIASKLPADSGWFDYWKVGSVQPPRGYAFAALKLPNDRFLLTYSVHLKSNRGDFGENVAQRQESARQLISHVQDMLKIYPPRHPSAVLLGGDFNTSLDDVRFNADQSLRSLRKAGFYWTHTGVPFAQRVTLPGSGEYPDTTFDHILTAGLGEPRSSVVTGQKVSDHNPVIVEIDPRAANFAPQIAPVAMDDVPMKPVTAAPAGTLAASALEELRAASGHPAKVHGLVGNVGANRTESIHFINFQGTKRGDFVAIVRKGSYPAVTSGLGITDLKGLKGKTIQVEGTVTIFNNTPQIEVTKAEQIQILN
jgi:hypothetical protein